MNLLACPGFSIDLGFDLGAVVHAIIGGFALALVPATAVSLAFIGLVVFVLARR